MIDRQLVKYASLIAAICAALTGQAHLLSEPWNHVLAIAGIVATAIVGWSIRPNGGGNAKPPA